MHLNKEIDSLVIRILLLLIAYYTVPHAVLGTFGAIYSVGLLWALSGSYFKKIKEPAKEEKQSLTEWLEDKTLDEYEWMEGKDLDERTEDAQTKREGK